MAHNQDTTTVQPADVLATSALRNIDVFARAFRYVAAARSRAIQLSTFGNRT